MGDNVPAAKDTRNEVKSLEFTDGLTVGTTLMKNCEPLVPGPALAILRVYGLSCLRVA